MLRTTRPFLPSLAIALLALPTWAQAASTDLSIQPSCPVKGYKYDATKKTCADQSAFLAATDDKACGTLAGNWDASAKQCTPKVSEPAPVCDTPIGNRIRFVDGQCVYDTSIPTSDPSNYKGDCFKVVSQIAGAPADAKYLWVSGQTDDGSTLKVLPADRSILLCKPTEEARKQPPAAVSTKDVLESGAMRSGWVYGTLLLPYKYRFGSKSIENNVTIGPYLGARAEIAGAAFTHAFSAGLTQLKVSKVDSSTNTVEETTVTGFTLAWGLMFDLYKSSKPFKSGFFLGVDQYSKLNGTKVSGSGKPWIAFQIGYDFTE